MVSFYGYSIIFLIIIEFYELNVLNNLSEWQIYWACVHHRHHFRRL